MFLSEPEDVHVLLGLSSHHFLSHFFNFFDVFQVPISIRIDRYFVGATHPTVFHPSFLNYAYLFYMVWRCACGFGIILPLFFINFFHVYWLSFFSGPISIGIDTLWAQLLLEFFTNHFETMHICSTWSEDVRVVLGLSFYHTSLKVTTLYQKAMTLGGHLPAMGF